MSCLAARQQSAQLPRCTGWLMCCWVQVTLPAATAAIAAASMAILPAAQAASETMQLAAVRPLCPMLPMLATQADKLLKLQGHAAALLLAWNSHGSQDSNAAHMGLRCMLVCCAG